jgi:hypothetical protein
MTARRIGIVSLTTADVRRRAAMAVAAGRVEAGRAADKTARHSEIGPRDRVAKAIVRSEHPEAEARVDAAVDGSVTAVIGGHDKDMGLAVLNGVSQWRRCRNSA